MSGRLDGRIALVVGAGQTPGATIGNGRATALVFAREGARVLCVDRDPQRAAETVGLITAEGGEAAAHTADVTREEDCASAVEACLDVFGGLHIVHNNVGIGRGDAGTTGITEEVWDRIMAVNLKGAVFTTKHALPHLRAQGHGIVINVSSVAAVCSTTGVAYKASKAALNAYTQSLAMANARYGVRANAIMPGLMNTPMAIESHVAAGADREELIARRHAAVPLRGGMGDAWDVAHAAAFLASDEARFITGVVLPVDGGQSARVG